MCDSVSIGPVPAEEDCECLGPNYDPTKARAECQRFIGLIRANLGPEPPGARLRVVIHPHDFGAYHDVVCEFVEEDEGATEYAYRCEAEAPTRWMD